MKKQMMTLALMLLVGAGAAQAQDCCKTNEVLIDPETSYDDLLRILRTKPGIVEAEKVETMLRAAMAAPTAMNRQPWHFVVVSDKQVLGELAGQGRRGDMLRNAPLAIIVCGDFTKTGEGKGQEFWIQDTSAATENLLLAAHAQGLGAVWTSAWPMDERYKNIQKVLSMPETIVPLCTVVIGYPDEQPTPKDKWKPENVSYNKYGAAK